MNKTMKYKLKLDYTADELKELKELSKAYDSPMYAISKLLTARTHGVENLQAKYLEMRHEDEFDLMADINNVIMGTAVFPYPKKYYVQLIAGDEESYLNINPIGGEQLYNRLGLNGWKTKFTRDEVIAIDPRLVPFMEEVEK
ncbi:hypothetical protein [Companilactobacillus mishanensis]|uniref:hypothetical protein n=1 Tax=Companilactobacillus mishanensis TaxID=2486008 RepID=UPI000F7B772C|nr:hypothetical protein [Companilactobacillus mishanensis]